MAGPSRIAAALDYLERLKAQADQAGTQTQLQAAKVARDFAGGVSQNLANRARDLGQMGYEAFTSAPSTPQTTAEFAELASQRQPTPMLDATAQGLGQFGKALVTDPIGTGRAMVSGELERARAASTSPEAAGEYAGSFIDPMRIAKGLRKSDAIRRDIFIGKSAKTWNQKEADRALAMEAYGVKPEKIWEETGTFRGPDGKWRQEISDLASKGKFTHLPPSEQRLSAVAIEHPELLKAYPNIEKIQQFGLREPKLRGSYEVAHIQTEEGPKVLGEAMIARGPDESALRSAALHEMQHAVQRREGFESGGNLAEFKNKPIPARLKDVAFSRSMREMAIAKKMRDLGYPVAENKVLNLSRPDTLNKVKDFAEKDEQLKALLNEYIDLNAKLEKYPDKGTQYARLLGEVEARAVQARQDLSPEERRAIFPLKSYDIPLEQITVRKK